MINDLDICPHCQYHFISHPDRICLYCDDIVCQMCGEKEYTREYAGYKMCDSCYDEYYLEHEPVPCPYCNVSTSRGRIDSNGRCDYCRPIKCATCKNLVDPPEKQCNRCLNLRKAGMCVRCLKEDVEYFNEWGECPTCAYHDKYYDE